MKNEHILIIGGTGFIGSALVDIYLKNAYEIMVLSQGDPGQHRHAKITKKIEYSEESFLQLFKINNFESIHFLSGNPSPHYSRDNPFIDLDKSNRAFLCLLEALRKVSYKGKLWVASSVAVYGANSQNPLSETSECQPLSSYGVSKLMNEELIKMYARTFGIRGGAYRIFSTYGPGLKRQIVFDLIEKLRLDPTHIDVLGDGNDSRDMTYVTDQANAIFLVDRCTDPKGEIVNVGSGNCYTVKDILQEIIAKMGIHPVVEFTQSKRGYDGKYWRADISKIEKLGWMEWVPLPLGIEKTISEIDL